MKKSYLFGLLLVFYGIAALLSCKKDPSGENRIFIWQVQKTTEVPLVLDNGKGNTELSIASAYPLSTKETVKVELLDSNYVNGYNEKNHTEFVTVPASAVSISASSVSFVQNSASAGQVTITVQEWPEYVDGQQYAVPVKIKPSTMPVVSGTDVALVVVSKIISSSAQMNGRFPIPDTLFGQGTLDQPYNNVTFEGQFNLTKNFIVPGNWRSDIFNGCGIQFMVGNLGQFDIRLPNAAFMGTTLKASLNNWYHFAITYSGSVLTLYVNGDQIGQTTYPDMKISQCFITPYTYFTGCIAKEFRIWKTVRTRKQLKTFMCAVNPSDPDLLGYWKQNEGTGNVIKDATGRGMAITSTNTVTWVQNVKCPQ